MANTIKIKNSGTASNAPSAASLEYGELAINYVDGKLYFKNTASTVNSFTAGVTNLDSLSDVAITSPASGEFLGYDGSLWVSRKVVTASDTAPASPYSGQLWYKSDTGAMLLYYDSTWVEIAVPSYGVLDGGTP